MSVPLPVGRARRHWAAQANQPGFSLDPDQRRAPIRSKGGDTESVYWDTGDRAPAAPVAAPARRYLAH